VSLLSLSTGSLLGKVRAGDEEAEVEDSFSSFDIEPRSEAHLATVARRSMRIQIWDIATQKELSSWRCAHQLPVLDLAYSPTGMDIATASADKSIVIYSVARLGVITHKFATSIGGTGKKAAIQGHKSRVTRVFWHPSAKRMELVSAAEDGEMRIWKLGDSKKSMTSL
jgi:WD40 repeat protein